MVERYLFRYGNALREERRLLVELERAKADVDGAYDRQSHNVDFDVVVQKHYKKRSPTEDTAIKIVDNYCQIVDRIKRELTDCQAIIADAQRVLKQADLDMDEQKYVRLRYVDGASAERTARAMYCCYSKTAKIRRSALEKIEKVSN